MARTTIPSATDFEARKATVINKIKGNDEDHETRIVVLENRIRVVTVTLDNNQIKALPTTPFSTLATPGSGFFAVPLYADVYLKFTGGAYTNIDPDAFVNINYADGQLWSTYFANDPAASPALTYVDDSFGAANNWRIAFTPWTDTAAIAQGWGSLASHRNVEDNQGMKLFFDNQGAGNLTGGNAANTLRVDTFYGVLAI